MHPLIDKFQSKAYCMFSVLYKIDLRNNLHPRRKKEEKKKKKGKERTAHFFPFFLCYYDVKEQDFQYDPVQKEQCIDSLLFVTNETHGNE